MAGTSYDIEAAKTTFRTGTRPWWFKLMVLLIFAMAIGVGAGVASLFK